MVDDDFDNALGEAISGQVGENPDGDDEPEPEPEPEDEPEPEPEPADDETDASNKRDGGDGDADRDDGDDDQGGDDSASVATKNYPFYITTDLADELDSLYKQYDAKNKFEDGDGLQKHRDVLQPIMQAAIDELDLDSVIDWEPAERDEEV